MWRKRSCWFCLIFTVAFILFLAPAGALTLRGQLPNPPNLRGSGKIQKNSWESRSLFQFYLIMLVSRLLDQWFWLSLIPGLREIYKTKRPPLELSNLPYFTFGERWYFPYSFILLNCRFEYQQKMKYQNIFN